MYKLDPIIFLFDLFKFFKLKSTNFFCNESLFSIRFLETFGNRINNVKTLIAYTCKSILKCVYFL